MMNIILYYSVSLTMKKIKVWDPVMVIQGADKGKVSKVVKIMENKVIVAWVNMVKKGVKWQWFKEFEKPIHISNIMYYDDEKKVVTKIEIVMEKTKNGIKRVRQTRTKKTV